MVGATEGTVDYSPTWESMLMDIRRTVRHGSRRPQRWRVTRQVESLGAEPSAVSTRQMLTMNCTLLRNAAQMYRRIFYSSHIHCLESVGT